MYILYIVYICYVYTYIITYIIRHAKVRYDSDTWNVDNIYANIYIYTRYNHIHIYRDVHPHIHYIYKPYYIHTYYTYDIAKTPMFDNVNSETSIANNIYIYIYIYIYILYTYNTYINMHICYCETPMYGVVNSDT